MVAIQVMLGVYAGVIAVAALYALIWPRLQRWLIRHGARDPQWLYINDEPPGFKQLRDELKRK
ncbi:MAG: hypothetical protein JNL19_01950 [Burkholderiales bacterium]|nr:hypothetical protein [Burkholderiales bacterium]